MKYIAFLRGINVGGKKKVPMSDLKTCFETYGFTNVKTLLNTGNVIFETSNTDVKILSEEIEKMLSDYFSFEIPILLRTDDQILRLIKKNPFEGIEVTKDIRLYVTFLSEEPKGTIKAPYVEGGSTIIDITKDALFVVVDVTKDTGTRDAMKLFDREFGKNITTRNWNTVVKIGKLFLSSL